MLDVGIGYYDSAGHPAAPDSNCRPEDARTDFYCTAQADVDWITAFGVYIGPGRCIAILEEETTHVGKR
jgi:hypothetical protein